MFALGLLVLILFLCNLYIGEAFSRKATVEIANNSNLNWAEKRFKSDNNQLPIQRKHTPYRILYLSNSHAFTGGYVSKHLQKLLDLIYPNEYEVLNFSAAGMFAPEFLERFAATTEYGIDIVILPVAYISFSDMMKLQNQSQSSQSFFKPDIFPKLPLGFWIRNYDISLFSNKLIERVFALYRYRDKVRDSWEQPLTNLLKKHDTSRRYLFLEVDENQSWKFPDGFDRSLFDWSLYALGRSKHLQEIQDLISLANKRNIPILASNLPIDFAKDTHKVDIQDYKNFQNELAQLFNKTATYINYQDSFPKEFSTYDALHPQWHGARLHALQFVIQLNTLRQKKVSEETIYAKFDQSDNALSSTYKTALNGDYTTLSDRSMRRYDMFAPENAKNLLTRLASTQPGSYEEEKILYQLSLRIRYWRESGFGQKTLIHNPLMGALWNNAVSLEISKATKRAEYFQEKLIALQMDRIQSFPITPLNDTQLLSTTNIQIPPAQLIQKAQYKIGGSLLVNRFNDTKSGKTISYTIINQNDNSFYSRIDLLGDGSFVQLSFSQQFKLPQWVFTKIPIKSFGI
jgi:hypothetical protein